MRCPGCLLGRAARLLAGASTIWGLGLAAPLPARAGDPIMPLAQVHAGMSCTGYSVIQGTTISSFAVAVVDVVAGGGVSGEGNPSILVRVSGPAVDVTGVGPGFSGSPIYCPDAQGVQRNIGAIAEGIGDYANKLALATPIERILGEPIDPPIAARRTRGLLAAAHPLPEPLVVSGMSGAVSSLFRRAAAAAGRVLYASPGTPRASYPAQTLRPGSAVSAGLSSGDINTAAIGTVAYTDGAGVWAFGHPLDSAGPRSLLLQDAYVYTVVNTPLPSVDSPGSYKLAAPGHDLGTVTNDGLAAITGRVGPLPPRFPLKVAGRSLDTGAAALSDNQIADESGVGLPTGISSLAVVGPIAVAETSGRILHGTPAQQSGSMCLAVRLRESKSPLGFCNHYVIDGMAAAGGASGGPAATPYVDDISQALSAIDSFKLGLLHITGVQVSLELGHGVRQGYMIGARALGIARAGRRLRLLLAIQLVRGPRISRVISVRLPGRVARGHRLLKLTGTPADSGGGAGALTDVVSLLSGTDSGAPSQGSDAGPHSVAELAHQIAGIQRFDGVSARFVGGAASTAAAPGHKPRPGGPSATRAPGPPRSAAKRGTPIYRDPGLRLSGSVVVRLTVG